MARKQSLANKRRAQKTRNNTRNKTRSMRKVNGRGGGILDTLRRFGRFGRSDSSISRSLLTKPLLTKPLDELAHVVKNGQPELQNHY